MDIPFILILLPICYLSITLVILIRKVFSKKIISVFDYFLIGMNISYMIPFILVTYFGEGNFTYYTSFNTIFFSFLTLFFVTFLIYIINKITENFHLKKKSELSMYTNKIKLVKSIKFIIITLYIAIVLYVLYLYILNVNFSELNNNSQLRQIITTMGPYVILLQLPIGIALYYIHRCIMSGKHYFTASLTIFIAVITSFIRGERTDLVFIILFPILVWYKKKKTIKPFIIGIILIFIVINTYSSKFKASLIVNNDGSSILLKVLSGDFDRNWTMWAAIDNSDFTSTTLVPYSGAGYVYTLFSYIPRSIVPFKGYSSASWFTINISPVVHQNLGQQDISTINWGYSLGLIAESIVNFGKSGIFIFSIIIGLTLSYLNRLVLKYDFLYGIISIISVQISSLSSFTLLTIHVPIIFSAILIYLGNKNNTTIVNERSLVSSVITIKHKLT